MPNMALTPDVQRVLLGNLNTSYGAELNQTYVYGGAALVAFAVAYYVKSDLRWAAALIGAWLLYKANDEWQAAQGTRVERDTVNMSLLLGKI